MSDGGACRRAPATPGLLNILEKIIEIVIEGSDDEIKDSDNDDKDG